MPRSITGTPSRRRTSRVAALLAAPAAAICLLSGCSAGQVNQTGRMVAPVSGVEAHSKPHGQAALRDVQIAYNNPQGYPVGATAPLSLYIANNDPGKPLVLRSVTAVGRDGAKLGTVVLTGGTADIGVLPSTAASGLASSRPSSAAPSTTPSTTPSGRASAGTAPSAGASGSAAPSAAPSPSPTATPANLTVPPNGYARLTPEAGAHLAIAGITQPLAPGSSAVVTFTFEGENPLEVPVPFGVPLSPVPRIMPSAGGNEESGAHGE